MPIPDRQVWHYRVCLYLILVRVRLAPWSLFKPSSEIFLLTIPRWYFFCRSFLCVFLSCVSNAFASIHCCLVVTCWERADLLALVGDLYCILLLFHVLSRGGGGDLLDCIISWSLPPFLVLLFNPLLHTSTFGCLWLWTMEHLLIRSKCSIFHNIFKTIEM